MHLVEKKQGRVRILSIKGKLVSQTETNKLHEKINELVENDASQIVLDLKQVSWLASLGIGAIMRNFLKVRKTGGDLRLTGLSEKVKSLFSITKLIGVIQIYDTVNEAVESFNETQK
jgi:anti-anti-sigma factor